MGYLSATRHPWPSLLFLLPLLAVYEGGVIWLGGADGMTLRNGADAWLRSLLDEFGFGQMWILPLVLIAWMTIWSGWRWADRPKDGVGLWLGMAIESLIFALGLWAVSRNFGRILDQLGIDMNAGRHDDEALRQVITYVGAGIYEEVLFRLMIYGGLVAALRFLFMPGFIRIPVAMALSSLAFAAAHHVGQYAEDLDPYVFAFRTLAGLYFAALYQFRGFGIAVGAHAGYDVIVGIQWG